jgi:RluA family pseudouridine synthase
MGLKNPPFFSKHVCAAKRHFSLYHLWKQQLMKHTFVIPPALAGMRLDQAIARLMAPLSIRKSKGLVDGGAVYLNNRRVRIASWVVKPGDNLQVLLENVPASKKDPSSEIPDLAEGDILYEDDQIIVINKPAGLASQPTRDPAVAHVLAKVRHYLTAHKRPGPALHLAHRLDKETTGCLIIAKSSAAMDFLTDQFRMRTTEKIYHALVWGKVAGPFSETARLTSIQEGTSRVHAVQKGGKSAHTDFKPIKYYKNADMSLVECRPHTGRSHQIRVHLELHGHPIVGDKVYGEKAQALSRELAPLITHHFLHARAITFVPQPGAAQITVEAPYPATMSELLKHLESP